MTTTSVGARLRGEPIEERAQRGVGQRDFAEVGIRREARRPLAGRIVGDVRIVDVHPDEPFAGLPADPLERGRDDGVGAPLAVASLARSRRADRGAAQIVVVDIEADAEAEAPIERKAADERASREALRLEPRRRCRCVGGRR